MEELKKLKEEYTTIQGDWNGKDDTYMSGGSIYHEEHASTAGEIVETIEKLQELISVFEEV